MRDDDKTRWMNGGKRTRVVDGHRLPWTIERPGLSWIRATYNVPVMRNQLVRKLTGPFKGDVYVVLGAQGPHVVVWKAPRKRYAVHPLDLEYKLNDGWVRDLNRPEAGKALEGKR